MASWDRLIRFQSGNGTVVYGQPTDSTLKRAYLIEGDPFTSGSVTQKVEDVVKILSPLALPPNIVCIGLNYKKHAEETGNPIPKEPVVFYKSTGAIQNPDDPIVLPPICSSPPEVDYEVELAVVIGTLCKDVTPENALNYVAGYTVANDVSARLWQGNVKGGTQWSFGKSFDTFCPLGPVLVNKRLINDPQQLALSCHVNGIKRQDSNTSDMIFSVAEIISFLSQSTTLLPGTLILTGTPEGVGFTRTPPIFLQPGDTVSVQIENIGKLTNPVRGSSPSKL